MSFPPNTGSDDDVVVLVGSPALGSRTSRVAQNVAAAVGASQARVIELAEVGPCTEKGGDSLRLAQSAVQEAGLGRLSGVAQAFTLVLLTSLTAGLAAFVKPRA